MSESNVLDRANNAPAVFIDADLATITDFSSAIEALNAAGVEVESSTDYGTGFEILKDKDMLKGVDFVILEWRFNDSDKYEGDFVSATLVTKDGRKLILNDGSTGIRDQLRMITNLRIKNGHPKPQAGILVRNGLTKSEYNYTDEKGKTAKAATYYLSE